ncbi:hypothetical protein DWW31_18615 [Clostridium sp. AF15-17LB]|nr:hypothetical protein DWW31_18615 [Clostridium sp. AF15-17LB]
MHYSKKDVFVAFLFLISLIFLIWYAGVDDYKEYSSINYTSADYVETRSKIVVHKAHYISLLYDEIAEKHNRLNGAPNKLTLELYFSERALRKGRPYRTVVFDYDNQIEYVLLDYME